MPERVPKQGLPDDEPAHEAFMGVYADHLYADCPSLRGTPVFLSDSVDPLGSDICGMCQDRWKRKHREAS